MREINTEKTMGNILQLIQTRPENYKRFGIYWWSIKAVLKRYYNEDNVYLLGDYIDESVLDRVSPMDEQAMLKKAFAEYTHNTTYPRDDKTVEDTDGELLTIYDEDAGI